MSTTYNISSFSSSPVSPMSPPIPCKTHYFFHAQSVGVRFSIDMKFRNYTGLEK